MTQEPIVLVVDDDLDVLEIAATIFKEMGLSVLRAESGAKALKMLRENPHIDLLFTDISMPEMTGWELAPIAKQEQCPAY